MTSINSLIRQIDAKVASGRAVDVRVAFPLEGLRGTGANADVDQWARRADLDRVLVRHTRSGGLFQVRHDIVLDGPAVTVGMHLRRLRALAR